jgi:hypothetical protein
VPLQQLVLEVVTDTAQRAAHFAAKRQWIRERSQLCGSAAAALALDFVEHFPLDRSPHATEMLQLRRRLERRQLLRTPSGPPRGSDGDEHGDGASLTPPLTSRARFDRSAVGQRIVAAAAAAAAQAATALLRNIVVVGGTADLPGLPARLAEEVKAAAAAAAGAAGAGEGGGRGGGVALRLEPGLSRRAFSAEEVEAVRVVRPGCGGLRAVFEGGAVVVRAGRFHVIRGLF